MSKKPKEPTQRLEDIVDDDVQNQSVVDAAPDASLSEEERERIENAMAFIQGVRPELTDTPATIAPSVVDTSMMNVDGTIDTSQSPETAKSAAAFRRGTLRTIGRFEIERLLGQGGFASVYLAHDPKLNRKIAIKVLKPTAFFSADASDRFDREAQAAAVLNHPNIIPVFESGTIDSDHYIVSAFSDGITLKQWTDRQTEPISPRTAAEIVSTLADAVEHAHQRGIVHRDLKPANVLVEMEEAEAPNGAFPGTLRVTDFGLAKYADSVDQLQTAEGAIVGTPAYMSPEQAKGGQDIGNSSDIYSLGVILYELLTGKHPILGQTHIETLLAIGET